MENASKRSAFVRAPGSPAVKKPTSFLLVPWLTVGILVFLVLPPLCLLIFSSFKSGKGKLPTETAAFSFSNYIDVYLSASTYSLIGNTFVFAAGSLIVGFAIATIFAWLLERTDIPFRNLIYSTVLIPLAIPGMLSAMVWVMLLSPRQGSINILLRQFFGMTGDGPLNIYSMPGMVLVEGINIVPTAFLMLSAAFRRMDASLEEASAIAGHSTFQTLRRITLPLIKPALLAALIYFFIICIESFEIPGVLGMGVGIHVLSTRIYWAMHPEQGLPDYGTATTLAMLFLVIAFGLIYVYRKLTGSAEKYQIITGKGYRPRQIELGRKKYIALAFVFCFLFLSVVLPILTLIWGSLFKYSTSFSLDAFSRMSLKAYWSTFNNPNFPVALKNTFIVGIVTATALMFIVSISSWIVVRSNMRIRKAVDIISFLPQAIPSAVIALALMLLYLLLPIPIYGTIWIIVLALTTRYLAFGSRTMNSAQIQIHPVLEEASSTSGASWGMTNRRIIFPLLLPALVNGWIWVAIHAARELTASLMLYSPNSIVLPTLLWSMWEDGSLAEVCVLGLFLIAILGFITFIGSYLINRKLKSKSAF
jgi:iron(III) transport system permease protein